MNPGRPRPNLRPGLGRTPGGLLYPHPSPVEMGERLRPSGMANEQPSAVSNERPRAAAPPAQYKAFSPQEVSERRAQFAKRQTEYSRSNTLSRPPSGNQFV